MATHIGDGRAGALFLIGGAEDLHGSSTLWGEFLRLAGGREARIAVLAVGPGGGRHGVSHAHAFRRLGAEEVRLFEVADRSGAVARRTLRGVDHATGVLITGADHTAMTALLGGTALDGLLHERSAAGMPLAGSGTGASLLGPLMVVGGASRVNAKAGGVALYPGLEFITGVVIDTHFSERCRHGRLLAAVGLCPHDLGLGIDEGTAALVTGEQFEVLGRGAVSVYDAGSCTYSNVHDTQPGESIALHDLRLHVLSAGHRFHLGLRAPLIEPSTTISRRMGDR